MADEIYVLMRIIIYLPIYIAMQKSRVRDEICQHSFIVGERSVVCIVERRARVCERVDAPFSREKSAFGWMRLFFRNGKVFATTTEIRRSCNS